MGRQRGTWGAKRRRGATRGDQRRPKATKGDQGSPFFFAPPPLFPPLFSRRSRRCHCRSRRRAHPAQVSRLARCALSRFLSRCCSLSCFHLRQKSYKQARDSGSCGSFVYKSSSHARVSSAPATTRTHARMSMTWTAERRLLIFALHHSHSSLVARRRATRRVYLRVAWLALSPHISCSLCRFRFRSFHSAARTTPRHSYVHHHVRSDARMMMLQRPMCRTCSHR